ncbi:MAG TPA: kelch repeat-containing protein [Longimicrobiaceae bacterium]|nr:kelch repeat-containing protein [Longimicrobiaceae bacterium]
MKLLLRRALKVAAVVILAACGGGGDPTGTTPNGSIKGVVTNNSGGGVANAAVALSGNAQAARTTASGADGVYTFAGVPPGTYTLTVTPPAGYTLGAAGTASVTVASGVEASASAFVLNPAAVNPGAWGQRASMLEANSEFALAESNGKLYVMGGYPSSRVTVGTVQIYDIATDRWQLGPQLPQPNNHGMAAAVNGKIYLIGGQTLADDPPGTTSYVNTVYELDPAVGAWVQKAPMPTARSGGVAVAHDGKVYVAGGRLPQGNDFAVYDPATDKWETLPDLPTQRNHITGAAINGRIHVVGGRQGNGLSPLKTTAHEVFDPQTQTWTTAAPMLSGRSGINGVMARGCFHVWGGEAPTGMTPQHEYYDPRTNQWSSLPNMPIPIHGVVGSAFVDGLIWVTGGGTQIGGSFGSLFNQVYRPAVSCE